MKCLILAGGFGTRLYPSIVNTAKALINFNGKSVITHIIERVPDYIDILVSINKYFEADFLKWQEELTRQVEICVEESLTDKQKKGATSAIDYWIKSKYISEDLLVIAADNYFEFDLVDMISSFDGNNVLVALHDFGDLSRVCEKGQPCQYGLAILDSNRIIRFDEKPAAIISSIVATGIYVLPRRIFSLLSLYCNNAKQDNLGSFISYLVEKDSVFGYCFKNLWLDIGDDIINAERRPVTEKMQ
ncbi:sugar phosphate nucleotidyltransferase [Chloroflexota bacterium]